MHAAVRNETGETDAAEIHLSSRAGHGRRGSLEPLRAAGHELILVDGGSRDGTPALAAGWVDRLLTSAPGRGRQLNRNNFV